MNTRVNHQVQRDGQPQGRHAVVLGGSLEIFKSKRSCDEDSNRNDIRSGSVGGNQSAQEERLVY